MKSTKSIVARSSRDADELPVTQQPADDTENVMNARYFQFILIIQNILVLTPTHEMLLTDERKFSDSLQFISISI